MGQQEIVAGSALRRLVLVLAVAAVMAAMMVAMASPAFASGKKNCETGITRPVGNVVGVCIPVGTHVVK
jgi:hypothetical protein